MSHVVMDSRNSKELNKLQSIIEKRKIKVLEQLPPNLDKVLRNKLTNKYLGVGTGRGRDMTGVGQIEGGSMFIVFPWWLAVWEVPEVVGDQKGRKHDSSYVKEYYRNKRSGLNKGADTKWEGRTKRPFARDTIMGSRKKVQEILVAGARA